MSQAADYDAMLRKAKAMHVTRGMSAIIRAHPSFYVLVDGKKVIGKLFYQGLN